MRRRWSVWCLLLFAPLLLGAAKRPVSSAPPGFVEMFVAGVIPAADGNTVFLHDAGKKFFIPIGIGDSEAHSIQLRLERRRFERPLTHDLVDGLLRELGGRLLKVHVDDLRSSVFVGTIFVEANGRVFTMDARPSDAIALALGNQVPIYVAQSVIDQTAIGSDRVPDAPAEPGPPAQPQSAPFPRDPKRDPISL